MSDEGSKSNDDSDGMTPDERLNWLRDRVSDSI